MNRWRFVLSIRWARYLGLAIVFAIACGLLSWWQLARREEKVVENARVAANYDAAPIPLDEALPRLDSYEPDDEWLPVEVTGVYEEQLLVRNRPLGGKAGFELLAPLRTADGSVFVVDRGWLPVGSDVTAPETIPAAPSGEVTVIARLKPGEPSLPGGTSEAGVLASIQLEEVARILDEPVYTEAYGLVASEDPAVAEMPIASIRPEPDEGPHLSYAFQWVIFAIIGFAGLGFAIRQEYRYLNAEDPEERERAAKRERKRAAKRTDSDVEDELIDSGGR
ncbi:SURF1 family protein [Herbiconiux sp. L3-i23]|uniref:SURF1 family cytochrome oxidase biogenesis protein n=1 Tax=Herbiconiux sp. L3-i23 TaxID=2905871 RepID=UPI002057847E|nr:SURF1 family protein [Herbiconiux sp. L3-i23]BDI22711.1 SURF1-like protein [Herbiconiux sp. L3-i23]